MWLAIKSLVLKSSLVSILLGLEHLICKGKVLSNYLRSFFLLLLNLPNQVFDHGILRTQLKS